jgi:glycosyltransferase involved in cell wall biosynthesis
MELQTPIMRMRMSRLRSRKAEAASLRSYGSGAEPSSVTHESTALAGAPLPATRATQKVLMVLYYFPPLGGGGTQRPLKFARYLPDYGWQPHVLTVSNSHYVVHDESLQDQISPELRITRTPALLPGRFLRKATNHRAGDESSVADSARGFLHTAFQFAKKSFYTAFFIPDEYIGWLPFAAAGGERVIKTAGIDLIFSSGPPNTTHMIARQLKRRTGLPWVADLRDLWDQYPDSYNPFRLAWRQKLDDFLERRTLCDADAVVVVSEEMQKDLLAKMPHLSAERIFIVTNGYDTADFVNLRPPHEPEVFTVVHSGSLFPWRGLQPFVRALRQFLDRCPSAQKQFRLKLLGIIPQQEKAAIAAAGLLENLVCLDYLPYHQALSHIAGAEMALLLLGENGHAPNVLTSKLFDYMGARRPILAIGPCGAAHQLIRQEKLGWAFRDDETTSIAETLRRHFEAWRQGKVMLSSSRPRRFDRRLLTEKLSHAFNTVVG